VAATTQQLSVSQRKMTNCFFISGLSSHGPFWCGGSGDRRGLPTDVG
jgi:hypothetical protein